MKENVDGTYVIEPRKSEKRVNVSLNSKPLKT